MSGKSKPSAAPWVDPDDAPALTDAFFTQGEWKAGERAVAGPQGAAMMRKALKRGRPKAAQAKRSLNLRYDVSVIEAFKATGKGWQTRMNDALKDWLKTNALALPTLGNERDGPDA